MSRIYLLRHGESRHNIAMKEFLSTHPDKALLEWYEIEDSFDPAIRDAGLTSKGEMQAIAMQEEIEKLKPSLLVLSPLTRNLQTGEASCRKLDDVEVLITPLLREHTYSTCDIGSPADELAAAWPRWEKHLSCLPAGWWSHDGESISDCDKSIYREPWQTLQNRADQLVSLLTEKAESHKCIVVVGHAVLFYAITGNWMANCELVELDVLNLRPKCACEGLACQCDMKEFDARHHT